MKSPLTSSKKLTAYAIALFMTLAITQPYVASACVTTFYFGNGTLCNVSLIIEYQNQTHIGPVELDRGEVFFDYDHDPCHNPIITWSINGVAMPNIPIGGTAQITIPGCGTVTLIRIGQYEYEIF